ncbi:MAG: hypothetical protein RBR02_10825 [Desulfuromonadaceae bacterium]|nr:hypothetical protein [Desulfuromonadaceae bacterium]
MKTHPTKPNPHMEDLANLIKGLLEQSAFFSDKQDEYEIVKSKLIYLWNEHLKGKVIILPEATIGSGLAKLEQKSPKINELIGRFYASANNN